MHASFGKLIRCLAFAAVVTAPETRADEDPLGDPEVQTALHEVANMSTWYHPDLFGMSVGMRRYAQQDYAGALKYFEIGAYYSDKLSQLSLGLMYMNGEGVEKDPVTAYAWFDLAAERGYPDFVATRESLKAQLSKDQLAQAIELRKKLGQRYGDDVAKWRLTVQLRQGRMQITGSHTGFRSGVDYVHDGWWDPKLYFARRDREWRAAVSVGPPQERGKPIDQIVPPAATVPEVDASANGGLQEH